MVLIYDRNNLIWVNIFRGYRVKIYDVLLIINLLFLNYFVNKNVIMLLLYWEWWKLDCRDIFCWYVMVKCFYLSKFLNFGFIWFE